MGYKIGLLDIAILGQSTTIPFPCYVLLTSFRIQEILVFSKQVEPLANITQKLMPSSSICAFI